MALPCLGCGAKVQQRVQREHAMRAAATLGLLVDVGPQEAQLAQVARMDGDGYDLGSVIALGAPATASWRGRPLVR
jgi:hypothetical protein